MIAIKTVLMCVTKQFFAIYIILIIDCFLSFAFVYDLNRRNAVIREKTSYDDKTEDNPDFTTIY